MDHRFSAFFLKKYRLQLQRGARSFYEDDISGEEVLRPNKLRQLVSRIVIGIITSSKMFKKKDGILKNPERITNQS